MVLWADFEAKRSNFLKNIRKICALRPEKYRAFWDKIWKNKGPYSGKIYAK